MVAQTCHRVSDRTLQSFVAFAGSSYTFGITVLLIIGWGVAGAFLAGNAIWQIAMQVYTPYMQAFIAFICIPVSSMEPEQR